MWIINLSIYDKTRRDRLFSPMIHRIWSCAVRYFDSPISIFSSFPLLFFRCFLLDFIYCVCNLHHSVRYKYRSVVWPRNPSHQHRIIFHCCFPSPELVYDYHLILLSDWFFKHRMLHECARKMERERVSERECGQCTQIELQCTRIAGRNDQNYLLFTNVVLNGFSLGLRHTQMRAPRSKR